MGPFKMMIHSDVRNVTPFDDFRGRDIQMWSWNLYGCEIQISHLRPYERLFWMAPYWIMRWAYSKRMKDLLFHSGIHESYAFSNSPRRYAAIWLRALLTVRLCITETTSRKLLNVLESILTSKDSLTAISVGSFSRPSYKFTMLWTYVRSA